MMAARVLFVTHSSSLVIPSGRAPRQRCRGSMFLFTKGMAHNLEFTEKMCVIFTVKITLCSTHSVSPTKIHVTFLLLKHLLQPSCHKILYNSYQCTGAMLSSQNTTRALQISTEDTDQVNNVHQIQAKSVVFPVYPDPCSSIRITGL